MATRRKTLGFDRKIQLDWLDATADWVWQGHSPSALRSRLRKLLEGKVAGLGFNSARGKTITVLLHVWSLVPRELAPLRDRGLELLQARPGRERLPLHWGMCVATYPFFRDVAATTGRLLALQSTVSLSQITRRMTETWGERSTVVRATQRTIRSFVHWKVLIETEGRGVFIAPPHLDVTNAGGIGPWLVEASISTCEHQVQPLRSLLTSSAYFPFKLRVTPRELADSPRLEVHRHGLDEDVVLLKRDVTPKLVNAP